MIAAADALQRGLHDALAADATLTALVGAGRIHDEPPRGSPFPFVTIGEGEQRPFDRAGQALEHMVTLHAWSRAGGAREAQPILAAIVAALETRDIPLRDHRLANLTLEVSLVRREADGATLHGLARFRAVTEPLS